MSQVAMRSVKDMNRDARRQGAFNRSAFTLLELLISLGIILILATLTMRLLNATLNSDRIRNGARELQSFLAGARDRAIYAGQPRGVRFIQDPGDRSTVRSFVYIGAPATFTDGSQVTVVTAAGVSTIPTPPSIWANLVTRGLLTDGATITLGGAPYTMARSPSPTSLPTSPVPGAWTLTKAYTGTTGTPIPYTLQLLPSVLPGEEPRALPQNIVIDLDNSALPAAWGSPGAVPGSLDLLFNPNGTVMGPVAAAGRIHFVLSEYADASVPIPLAGTVTGVPLMDVSNQWVANQTYNQDQWVVPNPQNDLAFRCVVPTGMSGATQPTAFANASPGTQVPGDGTVTWECYNPKTRLIVSLATQTGRVTTSPVYPQDKFRLAEIGEVTQ
jgi:prepilin-type N-terminal cleavage/methylation domain-containing protein